MDDNDLKRWAQHRLYADIPVRQALLTLFVDPTKLLVEQLAIAATCCTTLAEGRCAEASLCERAERALEAFDRRFRVLVTECDLSSFISCAVGSGAENLLGHKLEPEEVTGTVEE